MLVYQRVPGTVFFPHRLQADGSFVHRPHWPVQAHIGTLENNEIM
jgi:hypothetical protein